MKCQGKAVEGQRQAVGGQGKAVEGQGKAVEGQGKAVESSTKGSGKQWNLAAGQLAGRTPTRRLTDAQGSHEVAQTEIQSADLQDS